MRRKERLVEEMMKEVERDEDLTFEDVVNEKVDNLGFEDILELLKDYKGDEDLEEELKALVYERLYSDLEERYTEKHKSIF